MVRAALADVLASIPADAALARLQRHAAGRRPPRGAARAVLARANGARRASRPILLQALKDPDYGCGRPRLTAIGHLKPAGGPRRAARGVRRPRKATPRTRRAPRRSMRLPSTARRRRARPSGRRSPTRTGPSGSTPPTLLKALDPDAKDLEQTIRPAPAAPAAAAAADDSCGRRTHRMRTSKRPRARSNSNWMWSPRRRRARTSSRSRARASSTACRSIVSSRTSSSRTAIRAETDRVVPATRFVTS